MQDFYTPPLHLHVKSAGKMVKKQRVITLDLVLVSSVSLDSFLTSSANSSSHLSSLLWPPNYQLDKKQACGVAVYAGIHSVSMCDE